MRRGVASGVGGGSASGGQTEGGCGGYRFGDGDGISAVGVCCARRRRRGRFARGSRWWWCGLCVSGAVFGIWGECWFEVIFRHRVLVGRVLRDTLDAAIVVAFKIRSGIAKVGCLASLLSLEIRAFLLSRKCAQVSMELGKSIATVVLTANLRTGIWNKCLIWRRLAAKNAGSHLVRQSCEVPRNEKSGEA